MAIRRVSLNNRNPRPCRTPGSAPRSRFRPPRGGRRIPRHVEKGELVTEDGTILPLHEGAAHVEVCTNCHGAQDKLSRR